MRTFEELNDAVNHAVSINDAASLMAYADELHALATPEAEALEHSARGLGHYVRGNYTAAIEHYHRALYLYQEVGNRSGVAIATTNIGTVLRSMGNYSAALEHYQRALAMHLELGDTKKAAGVTNNIGNVHESTGNYVAALEHFLNALAINEELGNRSWVAINTGNIGRVHLDTGNYPAALEHFHRALAIYEELGNRSGVARITGDIGNVHHSTGNYPAALEHYHHALAMHQDLGERNGVAIVTGNIGNVHRSMGDYPAALENDYRALAMHEEMGAISNVAGVTVNIIEAMIASGEHADAVVLMQKIDALHVDDPDIVIQREQIRASLQAHRGSIDEATATLHAALLIAQEHSLAPMQAELHKTLRDLAQEQNDFAAYIDHNNEFTRITEEINGKEATLKMAMQEKQREIEAREREHAKHLAVLHSTLPREVADRVARGEVVNDHFENASVIFLDIVGFTTLSSDMSSQEVIALLDDIFTQCDAICAKHGVTKIKTIGDSYMAVSFDSVVNAALCAVEMSRISHSVSHSVSHEVSHSVSHEVAFRIGMHCGPVTAGVIGKERMQYDVWGDTVNVASRMESAGEPGRVHVSEAFAVHLKKMNTEYTIQNSIAESQSAEPHSVSHSVSHNVSHEVSHEVQLVTRHSSLVTSLMSLVTIERGSIDIKGKGPMQTYWLE